MTTTRRILFVTMVFMISKLMKTERFVCSRAFEFWKIRRSVPFSVQDFSLRIFESFADTKQMITNELRFA